jgi:hypothetical protein
MVWPLWGQWQVVVAGECGANSSSMRMSMEVQRLVLPRPRHITAFCACA